MRKAIILLAAFAFLWGIGSTKSAQANADGNQLLEACEWNDAEVGFCVGYIMGVIDTLDGWAIATKRCLILRPENAQPRQYVDIVLNELRTHPEKRHFPAVMLVDSAFRSAFPCQ